jgi:hypothetical protein
VLVKALAEAFLEPAFHEHSLVFWPDAIHVVQTPSFLPFSIFPSSSFFPSASK